MTGLLRIDAVSKDRHIWHWKDGVVRQESTHLLQHDGSSGAVSATVTPRFCERVPERAVLA